MALRDALAPLDPRVVAVADNFLTLQGARHQADYDHRFDITKAAARLYIALARLSVADCVTLAAAADPSYRRFLNLALGSVRIAKRR